MRLTIVEVRKQKQRPSLIIVQPFLHVRSLQMEYMPLVVDWTLLSKSTSVLYTFHSLISLNVHRLDLSTEKVTSLGMHDDSISSMTYVSSTSKVFRSNSLTTIILKCLFCSRCSHHWFMGSYTPLLGSSLTEYSTKLVWDTRKGLCSRPRQQQPCRCHG